MSKRRIAASSLLAIVGLVVCLGGAALMASGGLLGQPSPADKHQASLWLFGILIVGGAVVAVSGRYGNEGWIAGLALAALGIGIIASSASAFERRVERVERRHDAALEWINSLSIPADVTQVKVSERPASLHSFRGEQGKVKLELGSAQSAAQRFAIIDPVLQDAGASLVRGQCGTQSSHFEYKLDDGRLIEFALLNAPNEFRSTMVTLAYAREGSRPSSGYYSGSDPSCLHP